MVRTRIVAIALCGVGTGLMGCASDARYVYQDSESGVIGIPLNTPKTMADAQALMEKHFPGKNYEVVRTVEVETGGYRSNNESDASKPEADHTSTDAPSVSAGAPVGGKYGPEIMFAKDLTFALLDVAKSSHQRDHQHTEPRTFRESRIIYRKLLPAGRSDLKFAESPDFTPRVYSDEVANSLLGVSARTTKLAKARGGNTQDDQVLQTSGTIMK